MEVRPYGEIIDDNPGDPVALNLGHPQGQVSVLALGGHGSIPLQGIGSATRKSALTNDVELRANPFSIPSLK